MLENVYIKTGGTGHCFGNAGGGHGSSSQIMLAQVSGLWYILFICTGAMLVLTVVHNVWFQKSSTTDDVSVHADGHGTDHHNEQQQVPAQAHGGAAAAAWGGPGRGTRLSAERQRQEGPGLPGVPQDMQQHMLPGAVPSAEAAGGAARLHARKSNLGLAVTEGGW